jgi:hypothetical protein
MQLLFGSLLLHYSLAVAILITGLAVRRPCEIAEITLFRGMLILLGAFMFLCPIFGATNDQVGVYLLIGGTILLYLDLVFSKTLAAPARTSLLERAEDNLWG